MHPRGGGTEERDPKGRFQRFHTHRHSRQEIAFSVVATFQENWPASATSAEAEAALCRLGSGDRLLDRDPPPIMTLCPLFKILT